MKTPRWLVPSGGAWSRPPIRIRRLATLIVSTSVLLALPISNCKENVGPPPPPAPAIGLNPTSVSFSAIQGEANPAAQSVSVSNSGGGTLSGLGSSITYGTGQPTGWLSASLSSTTAPSTL